MTWTPDRIDRLKALWEDGHSASAIAAELGHGITCNAVIGKIHRLGIAERSKGHGHMRNLKIAAANGAVMTPAQIAFADHRHASNKKKRAPMPRLVAFHDGSAAAFFAPLPPTPVVDDIAVPESRRISIVELTNTTCRWPIGNPQSEDFGFCGIETANNEAKRPYCPYHARIAYVASRERSAAQIEASIKHALYAGRARSR